MKLVILDRDGVINQDSSDYIVNPEAWQPCPGALEAIARLHRSHYRVIVATNQSGLARGLFDVDMLHRIHHKMIAQVNEKGGQIEAIFFCPHHPEDGCQCRKPRPGLLLEAASRLGISLAGIPFVGDKESDLAAARVVNALPVLVRGATPDDEARSRHESSLTYDDLASFVGDLLAGVHTRRMAELAQESSSAADRAN